MSARRQTLVSVVLAIAGVALLIWQIRSAGTAELLAYLRQVGWGFAGILALSFGRILMRAFAWRSLIVQPVPLSSTLAATLTGDAIGNVMPGSLLVSEPAKAMYLGRGVPASHAFAALAAENYLYSVSVAVYIVLGTAAMLTAFDVPALVLNAGVAALVLMAVVLAGAGWLAWARPSLLSSVLARVPIPALTALVARVRDIETRAYGSVGGQGPRVRRVVACHLVFHALSFVEVWFLVFLLTGRWEPLASFVLDTASRVVNVVFRWVPMRAGVDEATSNAVAIAVGLPGTLGVASALVRKGRVIVWALVGFSVLAKRIDR